MRRFCKRCGCIFECTTYAGAQSICLSCDMRPMWLKGKSTLSEQKARMRFPKLFKDDFHLIKHGSNRRYNR